MKKHWFKAKRYGWGWTPATWQGWIMTLLFIATALLNSYRLQLLTISVDTFIQNFIPELVALIFLFIILCAITGEKPGWHWGNKK